MEGGTRAGLAELLQDTDKLVADLDGGQDLPRVVRSISQMITDGDQLWSRVSEGACSREQADVQAAILLGSQGFDLPKLSHRIDKLSTARSFGPLESIQPTDIDGFLRNERQNALTSAIIEHSKNTHDEVETFILRAQQERWEEQKRKVLSSIEFSADTTSDQRFQSFNDSFNMNNMTFSRARDTILSSSGTPIRARLSPEEQKYSRALSEHNLAYLSGALLGESQTLVDKMAQVAEQLELKDVALLWQLLQAMQSRSFDGRDDRLPLLHAAKRFLEKKHLRDLRATVYGNLNKASLGGVPGTAQLIRAYLNVRPIPRSFPDEPMVNDHPVWVVLYHALRCGDLACAREVALQAGMADLAGKFQECQRNTHQRLGDSSATELRIRYMREFGLSLNSGNPYERVVLAILAGCDVTNDHGVVGTVSIEDYLWVKMCKAIVAPIMPPTPDVLTLEKLQLHITDDYGENHFDAIQRPLQYAYVLLLTAQFEIAIEFLYRTEVHRCHAVHMAIALNQLGLLRNTQQVVAPFLIKENSLYQLNLARLVTSYTRRFEMAEPELALEYYFALKEKHEQLWLQCVIELVLETKSFAKILGQRNPDGGTVHGALDKFVSTSSVGHQARNRVAAAVAEAAESRGLNEDAIALYELADERHKCVELLIKVLSAQVTQAGPEGSKRAKLQKVAYQVLNRYPSADLTLLINLMSFFDFYHASKNDEALEAAGKLEIVPLQMDQVDMMVTTFCGLNEQVRRIIPDVLVALMTILGEQYKAIKRPSQRSSLSFLPMLGGGNDAKLDLIKRRANAIIKYAGMVPYRLPANVNARLVQMEANMA
ncbi:hypothetical protein BIW11_10615 [Tropilaelaps mercedesae]|uniref:Nuclear pore protein n=1 Tax=Tropilaelaps mercedesae TaxID=418985 RepID=A0A1V9XEZ6_9ACAR|nr:hypothetical protein BIW11_10615 [Tropilaelaps mercedesae]